MAVSTSYPDKSRTALDLHYRWHYLVEIEKFYYIDKIS